MAVLYGIRIDQDLIAGTASFLRELAHTGFTIAVKVFTGALRWFCFSEISVNAPAGI